MFEETNQTMEQNGVEDLPENLFEDDGVDTETTPAPDNGESGSDSNNAQGAGETSGNGENHAEGDATSGNSVIRVKYNGEERDISLDEARTLAQKGLNYDHVVAERDKNRSAFAFLLERAKSEGITVEQLIERERGNAEEKRLEAKMSEIRARDDDASEETIRMLAQFELDAEKRRAEEVAAENLKKKNEAEQESWNKLFRTHPELKESDVGQSLFKDIFALMDEGYSPLEAFYIQRNRELETQNKMYSSAEAAKKKSVGSLAGNQGAEEDDFLAGFDSE